MTKKFIYFSKNGNFFFFLLKIQNNTFANVKKYLYTYNISSVYIYLFQLFTKINK